MSAFRKYKNSQSYLYKIFLGDKDASSAVKDFDEHVVSKQVDRSHEGYLYKQANSIYKGWRLSYYVIEDKKTVNDIHLFQTAICSC